jgi:heat shock protein HslJ
MAVALIVLLAGCSTDGTSGSWVVTQLSTAEGNLVAPISPGTLTLEVDDGAVSGASPCSSFRSHGSWPGADSTLSVSTNGCADPALAEENALFLSHLQCTANIAVQEDVLTASHADGSVMLVLDRTRR